MPDISRSFSVAIVLIMEVEVSCEGRIRVKAAAKKVTIRAATVLGT